MLAERVEESRDTRILPHYDYEDLANETVAAYRQRLTGSKPDYPYNALPARDFLRPIGACIDGCHGHGKCNEFRAYLLTFGGQLLTFGGDVGTYEPRDGQMAAA